MVGSPYPGTEEGPKGLAVRQLKGYASWVSKNEPSIPRHENPVIWICRRIKTDS